MTLKETIKTKRIEYFKAKNEDLKMAYEAVLNRIMTEEKSGKYTGELPDDVVQTLIKKEIKESRDTLTFYKETDEQYKSLLARVTELEQYLPAEMSEEDVVKIIQEVIATGETNRGKIIGAVIKKVGNSFDKGKVPVLVGKLL